MRKCLTTGIMQFCAVLPWLYDVFCKALFPFLTVTGIFCKDHGLAIILYRIYRSITYEETNLASTLTRSSFVLQGKTFSVRNSLMDTHKKPVLNKYYTYSAK